MEFVGLDDAVVVVVARKWKKGYEKMKILANSVIEVVLRRGTTEHSRGR